MKIKKKYWTHNRNSMFDDPRVYTVTVTDKQLNEADWHESTQEERKMWDEYWSIEYAKANNE